MSDVTTSDPNEPDGPDPLADVLSSDPAAAEGVDPDPERPLTLDQQKEQARAAIVGDDAPVEGDEQNPA